MAHPITMGHTRSRRNRVWLATIKAPCNFKKKKLKKNLKIEQKKNENAKDCKLKKKTINTLYDDGKCLSEIKKNKNIIKLLLL